MRKKTAKSSELAHKTTRSSRSSDCYLLPEPNAQIHPKKLVSINEATSPTRGGSAYARAFLDGNYARRKHPTKQAEYTIWDTELKGFGLHVLPSGSCFWTVRSRQRGIRDRAGLSNVRLHDLRHTFASHAATRNETLSMIGRLLGHRSLSATSRYAHLGDEHVSDAAQQIGAAMEQLLIWQTVSCIL